MYNNNIHSSAHLSYPTTFDIEAVPPQPAATRAPAAPGAAVPAALPPPVRSHRNRNLLIGGGLALVAGGTAAAVVLATKHHKSATPNAPAPVPAAPAPAPVARLAPPPPAPVNTNITGFLNVLPFSMKPATAMYVTSPVTGGNKFAVVLTDANETCQSLTAGPVRGSGIQEIDLCQVTNGSTIAAQNGRIIQNGQQYQSVSMSLNGTVANNGVLSGTLQLNTTNNGYVVGNFAAEPCSTLVYTNFCNLQD